MTINSVPSLRLLAASASYAAADYLLLLHRGMNTHSPAFFSFTGYQSFDILTHSHMEVSLMGYPQIIQSNRILPYKPTILGHPHVWKPPSVSTCILDHLSPELTKNVYGKISECILPQIFSYHISIIQWIGLRENLQETIDFPIKYGAFL